MPHPPVSLDWPGKRALLLVHGIGNPQPGYYDPLVAALEALLGATAGEFAIYELFYDQYNDWTADKIPLAQGVSALKETLKSDFGGDGLAATIAEFGGDVIWPVLNVATRSAIRTHYLLQLQQMALDGTRSGVHVWDQQLSIICHSMGCFHTYEALHTAASDPSHALQPLSNGVTFANVIFMASPVQLIRSVAGKLGPLVPQASGLATLRGAALVQPGQRTLSGGLRRSVKRWVSITGELDPVGGYLFRSRLPWANMAVDGQTTVVDDQHLLSIGSLDELRQRFAAGTSPNGPPSIGLDNPHSWQGYVVRHTQDLRQWLSA